MEIIDSGSMIVLVLTKENTLLHSLDSTTICIPFCWYYAIVMTGSAKTLHVSEQILTHF